MKTLLFILLISICCFSVTEAQSFKWAFSAGAHINDYNTKVVVDREGNIYTAGVITGGMLGDRYIFEWAVHISKFSSDGQLLWVRLVPRSHNMYVRDLCLDDQDNLFLLGSEPGDLVFEAQQLNKNYPADSYILKLDKEGQLKGYGFYQFRIEKIKVLNDDVYFTAFPLDAKLYRQGRGGAKLAVTGDFFARMKLGEEPEFLFTTEGVGNINHFDMDSQGHFIFTAKASKGNVRIGMNAFEMERSENILFKYVPDGTVTLLTHFYSIYERGSVDMVLDKEDNIYLAHQMGSDLHIDGKVFNDTYGVMVMKFSKEGKLLFKRHFNGTDASCVLAIDKDNALIAAIRRYYLTPIDFYPGEELKYNSGMTLYVKFHPEGYQQWARTSGGQVNDMVCGADDAIYMVGYYNEGSISFDGHWVYNNSGNGDADLFIAGLTDPTGIYCPEASPVLIADKHHFCEGDTSVIKLDRSFGYDFTWYQDDTPLDANDSVLHVTESGTYRLVINQQEQCPFQTNTIALEQHPIPVVMLVASDSTFLCPNDSVVLATVQDDTYNYQWYYENELQQYAVDSGLVVKVAGQYKINVDNNFCMAKDSIQIENLSMPQVTLNTDSVTIENADVVLNAASNERGILNWYYDYDMEAFSRDRYLRTGKPGNYLVIASNYCGMDADNVYVIDGRVGIDDLPGGESVSMQLYPNPCDDVLHATITGLQPEEVTYTVFNASGRSMIHGTCDLFSTGGVLPVNTSGLKEGVYFIKVVQNQKMLVKKFMVNKL